MSSLSTLLKLSLVDSNVTVHSFIYLFIELNLLKVQNEINKIGNLFVSFDVVMRIVCCSFRPMILPCIFEVAL